MKCSILVLLAAVCVLDFACGRPSCPKLYLKNGRVRNKPRIFAQFNCNRGFYLLGDRYSKCQDGAWDNPVPICVRPSCKIPQPPKFGMIYTSFRQAVLRFFCNPEYELHGPSVTHCDGTAWNTHMPSCIRTNTTPSISCDFESPDICGWAHDLNHDFSWERLNRPTPSWHVGTGPAFDHTKGQGEAGYYMYIESSFKNENDTARLISPIYPKQPSTKTCLEFYYHMYGSGIGQLQTYLKTINDSWVLTESSMVFKIVGNQGNIWRRGFVELGVISKDFQIIFEGVRGISHVSDIAIDDVKLIEDCNTDEVTTVTTEIVEMSTVTFESCENRCFKTNETLIIPSSTIACDCDENCQERNSCCPDFASYCIIDITDTVEDTTIENSSTQVTTLGTDSPTIRTTGKPPMITTRTMTEPVRYNTTTTWYRTSTSTTPRTTSRITSTTSRTMSPSTSKPSTTTKSTTPKRSTTPRGVSSTTTPTRSSTNTSPTSTEKYMKTTSKVRYINDVVTFSTDIDDKEYTFNEDQDGADPRVLEHPDEKSKPSTAAPNNSLTTKVVIICSAVVFVVLAAIFALRKVSIVRCLKMKKMRNANGDSQSDVRFLTSDEILDFTLATPRGRRDY